MSDVQTTRFTCAGCGKPLPWKPEVAGRRIKCKCGHIMQAPQRPETEEDLYDLAEDPTPATKRAPADNAAAAPEKTHLKCPSCGLSMIPGKITCQHCGYNIKTRQGSVAGVKVGAIAGMAGGAGAAWSGGRSVARTQPPGGGAVSGKMKVLIGVACVVVVGGGIGGFKLLSNGAGAAAESTLGNDGEIMTMAKRGGMTELHQWLKESERRSVMGMTREQADKKADRLYDLGAKKVVAFGSGITGSLAIELPPEPAKRKALFDWAANWYAEMGETPPKDVRQKYILLKMHI